MAVRVADTPEVSPLPATEPGPGYTTPRIFAVDYTGEPLKVTQTLSEAGRLREEARRADVKLKVQDAVTHYQFDLRQYMTAEKGPLQKQGSQVLGKDLDGRDYRCLLYTSPSPRD